MAVDAETLECFRSVMKTNRETASALGCRTDDIILRIGMLLGEIKRMNDEKAWLRSIKSLDASTPPQV